MSIRRRLAKRTAEGGLMQLGVPSYIFPGTYLENIRFVTTMPEVQVVELLFFMWDEEADRILRCEEEQIRRYGGLLDYTVHMPDVLRPEHARIVDMTRDFVKGYVIHSPPDNVAEFARLVNDWRCRYGDIFLLENLIGRDFEAPFARLPGVPICFDVGHCVVRGGDPADFIGRHGDAIREIHLHSVEDGTDHRPLTGDEAWFAGMIPFLRTFDGVVNMEQFDIEHVRQTLRVLTEAGLCEAS